MLTPEERRGALVVLALVLIGAGWDATARWRRPAPHPVAASGPVLHAGSDPPGDPTAPPPARADSAAAERGGRGSPGVVRVISLNRATVAELDELPGIGPVLARRIVEHRERFGPFRSPEELRAVRGVGPALLARLRDRVRTTP